MQNVEDKMKYRFVKEYNFISMAFIKSNFCSNLLADLNIQFVK
jgi:hypothetical protein